jgi:hypothetical protein
MSQMALRYTDQTALAQGANPTGTYSTRDQGGRVRVITASINPVAAAITGDQWLIGTLPAGARYLFAQYLVVGPMPATFNLGTNCASALYGILSTTVSSSGVLTTVGPVSGAPAGQSGFLNGSISTNAVIAKTVATSGKKEQTVYLTAANTVSVLGSVLLALYYVQD